MTWRLPFSENYVSSHVLFLFRRKKNSLKMSLFNFIEEPYVREEVDLLINFLIFEVSWKCMVEVLHVNLQQITVHWNASGTFDDILTKLHFFSEVISHPVLSEKYRFLRILFRSWIPEKHYSSMHNVVEGPIFVTIEDNFPETNLLNSDVVDNYSEVLVTFLLKNQWKERNFK